MSDTDGFEELVSSIEAEMDQALIERRGAAALMFVRIAGALYAEAIGAGVPHDLAKEMATDYWVKEMHPGSVTSEDGSDVE
ncbi:hypothetical protein ACQEVX_30490 [Streptomyces syringium]|uniref:hypothetical protein n=1 Tax=Streptomyces syringium TaxID=76729 RepID=UPI003D8A763F